MWSSIVSSALQVLGISSVYSSHYLGQGSLSQVGFTPGYHGYDGPLADGGHAWTKAYRLAEEAVKKMTLEEKVNLTTAFQGPCQANSGGVPRLHISPRCYSDGPAGPRYTDFTSQYLSAVTVAASFDTDLAHHKAVLMGREFRGKGITTVLGPITGGPLGRSPFSGRNWEGFTPDPYLSAKLSYLTVLGIQSAGVITSLKHYILYEQEPICTGELDDDGGRTNCTQVSANIGDKVLHELYLPSFVEGVRAGAGSVMCSYNRINGTQSCENGDAMNRILKGELGFQGFVLSDFGATHSTVDSANSGMDMELPGEYFYGNRLKDAVKHGKVSPKRLDDMAKRILTPYFALGQHKGYPSSNYHKFNFQNVWEQDGKVFRNEHINVQAKGTAEFIRKAAADSTVLLKNEGNILPLRRKRRIGIFGSDAGYPPQGLVSCGPDLFCLDGTKKRHWNGTVTIGGGSGAAYPPYISAPLEAISLRGRHLGAQVDFNLHDGIDQTHLPAITGLAAQSDVCLVFVSLFLVEGWDRDHLRLDKEGEKLILLVAEHCEGRVVVVVHAGSQVLVEEWIDHPNVAGVLYAFYPGQETGNAIADILFGNINPSAKMPFTIGYKAEDYPPETLLRKPEARPVATFPEGLAVDYKWFEKTSVTPRFGFGFGLSYTTFKYSNLDISLSHSRANDSVQHTNERFLGHGGLYDIVARASVKVTNTGNVSGADVVQLYMRYPHSEKDQPRHLRGFSKPYLRPGHSARVSFPIRAKDMSVWDVEKQAWRIPKGRYRFDVARSSSIDHVELHDSVSFWD